MAIVPVLPLVNDEGSAYGQYERPVDWKTEGLQAAGFYPQVENGSALQAISGLLLDATENLLLNVAASKKLSAMVGGTEYLSISSAGLTTLYQLAVSKSGGGDGIKVGDDAYLGDLNVANTVGLKGVQDATKGYIRFGNSTSDFGWNGANLVFGAATVWHAGNLTPSNYALLTGATFTGDVRATNMNQRLRAFTIIPGGYVEDDPVNFRFDQDMLRYVTRWVTPPTTLGSGFSAGEMDILFSSLASFVNLSGKVDGCSIEITGLPNLGGSSNGEVWPFILMHQASTAVRVKMELEKQLAPGVWVTAYDSTPGGWVVAKFSTSNGYLTGVRWTFYNVASPGSPFATNIYVRSLGCIGRNTVPFVWNVVKGGDTMYGDLNFPSAYTVKVNGNAVWHAGNLTPLTLSSGAPADINTSAAAGSGTTAAKWDHVHRLTNGVITSALGYTPPRRASNDYSIAGQDTRSTVVLPEDRAMGLYLDFKGNATSGLSDGGSYAGVIGIRQWGSGSDWSGGIAHELAVTDNGNLWMRDSSGNTWGAWKKFWHTNNDGPGTGLDADMLDGNHASAFSQVGHTHIGSDVMTAVANATTATKVNAGTLTGTTTAELVRVQMGDTDFFRILAGATATNAGYAEIATADDGTEPIYVRQYTGDFAVLSRTLTLLDAAGNTSLPGSLTLAGTGYRDITADALSLTTYLAAASVQDSFRFTAFTTRTAGRTFAVVNGSTTQFSLGWDNNAWFAGSVNAVGGLKWNGTDVSLVGHNHSGVYEPTFSKNTAFNTNFGTSAGTTAEGNHTHSYLPVAGKAADSELLDGIDGLKHIAERAQVSSPTYGAEMDAIVDNGFRQVVGTGDSRALLSFNAGGSCGPVQMEFAYGGTLRWRNKTDSTTWTGWKSLWHSGNLAFGTGASNMATGNHTHSGVYEPTFSKNTGFNLNLGTGAGTVSEGNHTHNYVSLNGGVMVGNLTAPRITVSSGVGYPTYFLSNGLENVGYMGFNGDISNFTISNNVADGPLNLWALGNINIAAGASKTVAITGNALTFNGTNVSLAGHTHSYMPLTGGTVSGDITVTGSLNLGASTMGFTPSGWGLMPGYRWSGAGNSEFRFYGDNGLVNVKADGQFYANEGADLVWNAGNDGPSSGLDADTLDGSHASAFATSGHVHTFGTPSAVGTVNSAGSGSTYARDNHVHAHGAQTDGTLHAAATTGTAGFMSTGDKLKLDGLPSTAVPVSGGTFSGAVTVPQLNFTGATGDPNPVIVARPLISGDPNGGAERTELLLFHANDPANGSGPDCITLRAPVIRLQTHSDAAATIDTTTAMKNRLYIAPDGAAEMMCDNTAASVLNLRSAASAPWALTLERTDLAFNKVSVFNNGGNWYFNAPLLVNGNTVWNAGNDGAGSGLDADLLDGNDASAFSLTSHTHSEFTNATSAATANTLAKRDASGNFRAAAPIDTNDVATKGWVEAAFQTGQNGIFTGNITAQGGNVYVKADPVGAGVGLRLHHNGTSAYVDFDGHLYLRGGGTDGYSNQALTILSTGIASFGAQVQAPGLSTSWGTTGGTLTGAYNAYMGTGAGASWLLSGTSNGTFRYGIQGLDSGGYLRFYMASGGAFMELRAGGDLHEYRLSTAFVYKRTTNGVCAVENQRGIWNITCDRTGTGTYRVYHPLATATSCILVTPYSESWGNRVMPMVCGRGAGYADIWFMNDGSAASSDVPFCVQVVC